MGRDIKAIETPFDGYIFRSRLEARWALFFNELGIEYYYETEGFDFGVSGRYLPDFYLPKYKAWIEVKPLYIDADTSKFLELCLRLGPQFRYWFVEGDPGREKVSSYINTKQLYFPNNPAMNELEYLVNDDLMFGYCEDCHGFGAGKDHHIYCDCVLEELREDKQNRVVLDSFNDLTRRAIGFKLVRAYMLARVARYKHGVGFM